MSQQNLLPLEQWTVPIEGTTEVRLREPTGELYDPLAVPAWLGRASLAHLEWSEVSITLLYNQRQTGADLGAPGEFEALAQTATLLGDTIKLEEEQDFSYGLRRQEAFMAKGIPLLSLQACRDERVNGIVRAIGQAWKDRMVSANLLQSAFGALEEGTAAQREFTAQLAGGALTISAKEWMMLATISDALTLLPTQRHHIVLSLSPLYLDLERKLTQVLDVPTEARRIREAQWPNSALQGEVFHDVLARGKFDTAA